MNQEITFGYPMSTGIVDLFKERVLTILEKIKTISNQSVAISSETTSIKLAKYIGTTSFENMDHFVIPWLEEEFVVVYKVIRTTRTDVNNNVIDEICMAGFDKDNRELRSNTIPFIEREWILIGEDSRW